jgi:hypothetical protein
MSQPQSSSVEFKDTDQSLSQALESTAAGMTGETVTLREVFAQLGEHGLLAFCAFLTLPFLIPVSIPGVSTVFSIVIILLGLAVTLNRLPWLPARLMNRQLVVAQLKPTLQNGAKFVARFDRFLRPRLLGLTASANLNRLHGLALIFGAVLLMFPLGLVPLSNTLPALAILFLSLGIVQRDGVFVLLGYVMNVVTLVYFAVLAAGVILAGQGLGALLGS